MAKAELTAKFLRSYPKNGKLQLVYTVSGTPEAIAEYKAHKADFYREDNETGKPLFFTTRDAGDKAPLVKSKDGEYYLDSSERDRHIAFINQTGGVFGQVLAKEYLNQTRGTDEQS